MAERSWSHRGRQIVVTVRTDATPEAAFQAWADPAEIARWFVDRADGPVEPGSTYTWHWDDFGFSPQYEVIEVDPPHRLVLGFDAQGVVGFLEVVIERDGGKTAVRLINSGFGEGEEWDDQIAGINSGWHMALGALRLATETYPGQPVQRTLIKEDVPQPLEAGPILQRFTTEEGLASWLTEQGSIGEVGTPVALHLKDGGTLTGEVLARTTQEALISARELRGALGFKAFGGFKGHSVALHVHTWGEAAPPIAHETFRPAVQRLAALAVEEK